MNDLIHIENLIYYDGPLLAHFKNAAGANIIYFWADVIKDTYKRWLVFEVSDANLDSYKDNKISTYQLIMEGGGHKFVDIDNDINEFIFLLF